jgi:hypothetical protein
MTETQIRGLRELNNAVSDTAGTYAIYVFRKGKKFCKMFGLSEEVACRFARFYKDAVVAKVS